MTQKHKIEIDVTPVVEGVEKAKDVIDEGLGFLRDMTQRAMPAPRWVSEDNPYRAALLVAMERFERMEEQARDDAKRLGEKTTPARVHQEGRAHGFRDARSLVQSLFPPEPVGKIKPGK